MGHVMTCLCMSLVFPFRLEPLPSLPRKTDDQCPTSLCGTIGDRTAVRRSTKLLPGVPRRRFGAAPGHQQHPADLCADREGQPLFFSVRTFGRNGAGNFFCLLSVILSPPTRTCGHCRSRCVVPGWSTSQPASQDNLLPIRWISNQHVFQPAENSGLKDGRASERNRLYM